MAANLTRLLVEWTGWRRASSKREHVLRQLRSDGEEGVSAVMEWKRSASKRQLNVRRLHTCFLETRSSAWVINYLAGTANGFGGSWTCQVALGKQGMRWGTWLLSHFRSRGLARGLDEDGMEQERSVGWLFPIQARTKCTLEKSSDNGGSLYFQFPLSSFCMYAAFSC